MLFRSPVDFTVSLGESVLARICLIVRLTSVGPPAVDSRAVEAAVHSLTRNWTDLLREAAMEHFGEARAYALLHRYGEAFRGSYRETYPARLAVHDIERMERLGASGDITMTLYRPLEAAPEELRFKLFQDSKPIPLSDEIGRAHV